MGRTVGFARGRPAGAEPPGRSRAPSQKRRLPSRCRNTGSCRPRSWGPHRRKDAQRQCHASPAPLNPLWQCFPPSFLLSRWSKPSMLTHPDFRDGTPSTCKEAGSQSTAPSWLLLVPPSPLGAPFQAPTWGSPGTQHPLLPPHYSRFRPTPPGLFAQLPNEGTLGPCASPGLIYVCFRLPTTWGDGNATPARSSANSRKANSGTCMLNSSQHTASWMPAQAAGRG